ncbi:MAG TPA: hypothetical protein VIG51_13710 [Candidatus Baltobacteraceae bacterium]|jgi:hypothetical protein
MTSTGTTSTPTKVIPLISSGSAGPLGAIHLPRLWAKLTLASAGKLAGGYDECGAGFDQMTLTGLNLDRQKAIDYVRTQKPTYMQFEAWVLQQNGGKIDPDTIRKHNDGIRAYHHNDSLAEDMRKASGIPDTGIKDAVTLNMIEDLDELRRNATGR